MHRFVTLTLGLGLGLLVTVGITAQEPQEGGSRRGWTIPEGAAKEPNPIPPSADVIAKGKSLYGKNCENCHGKSGKGDGPDADPDSPPEDLGDPSRVNRNPDGVMFYKIWNGRKSPKMPAFKSEGLTRDEVWHVIHFIKTFRTPA
jgi:mono/diheme cytochrome c family protein